MSHPFPAPDYRGIRNRETEITKGELIVMKYDFAAIEKKWQNRWEESKP